MKKLSAGVALAAALTMSVSLAQAENIVTFELQADGGNSIEILSSADNGFMPSVTIDVYVDTNQPLDDLIFNFSVSASNTHGPLWAYTGLPEWGPMAYEMNGGDTFPIVVDEVYRGHADDLGSLDDPGGAEEFFGQWGDTTIGKKLLASYTFEATQILNPPRTFIWTIEDIGNGFKFSTADSFALEDPQTSIPLTVQIVSFLTVGPDADKDNDVDQSDFGRLQACLGLNPIPVNCQWADFNSDGLINNTDRTVYLDCFSGAGVPPVLGCDE